MAEFNPSPHDKIIIASQTYEVTPHPSVPAFAFGQEGRKGFVYQLAHGGDSRLYALKKFKEAYRVRELIEVCNSLARFSQWPGLEVCARQCLQYEIHDDVLQQFPDLEYAVLMPWISGSTWYDIVIGEKPLTENDSLTLANATAQVLAALEESGLAHCDIAGSNIILNLNSGHSNLIDIEDLFAPGFDPPAALPAGTEGYAHITSSKGQWSAVADRFAAAVLLAEMLCWHQADIRKLSDEEHYFDRSEMQADSIRYQRLVAALDRLDTRLRGLFEQAWHSTILDECPRIAEWQAVISERHYRAQLSKVVSDWQPILPGVRTQSKPVAESLVREPQQARPRASHGFDAVSIGLASTPTDPVPVSAAPVRPSPRIKSPPLINPVIEWRALGIAQSEPVSDGSHSLTNQSKPTNENEAENSPPLPTVLDLLKPILNLSHIDKRNRPHLVWSESPGATIYLLQESISPSFESSKENRVKAQETKWQSKWGRSGSIYYRVRAENADASGPWSDVLSVQVAK